MYISFALLMILVPGFCVCVCVLDLLLTCLYDALLPTFIHVRLKQQPRDGTHPLPGIKELHYLLLQNQDLYFCCFRDVWLV